MSHWTKNVRFAAKKEMHQYNQRQQQRLTHQPIYMTRVVHFGVCDSLGQCSMNWFDKRLKTQECIKCAVNFKLVGWFLNPWVRERDGVGGAYEADVILVFS